ncbi:MAG: ribonucleoside-diphosphate reductase subunit alpha [Patescibacteria group bacterium]
MNISQLLEKYTSDLSNIDKELIISKFNDSSVSLELDESNQRLLASICANLGLKDYQYQVLGGRLLMDIIYNGIGLPNITFSENLNKIYSHTINGQRTGRISTEVMNFVKKHEDRINKMWNGSADFDLDYSAVQSFEKRGLERLKGKIIETPSFSFLRVAVGLNVFKDRSQAEKESFVEFLKAPFPNPIMSTLEDVQILENIEEYYTELRNRRISLPGPIILHAGSDLNQMASCYLQYSADSLTGDEYNVDGKIDGILKAVSQLSAQSKGGGGNAIAIHDIRGNGSLIKKTNGFSNGILPFMKMFDATIGAINQSGKRAGTCAVYLEPWHIDIIDYLNAGNHFTIEEKRCKNLFYGLFVNDLFFERMVNDQMNAKWTLFDPSEVSKHLEKPLSEYYGPEFKEKYEYLETLGIGKEMPLMEIWMKVLNLFQTTGNPYIVNKDAMNMKSNQQNIGSIKSSNLCTEIALVSNNEETAVCVLSSICVSRFVNDGQVDYEGIIKSARLATRNLNNVIDLQYYPTRETRNSCLARRAIGVGAQGLADVFAQLGIAFTSEKAMQINKKIYEAIYYGCIYESNLLAKQNNRSYTGFENSNLSKGVFQFDMWGTTELFLKDKWAELKESVKQHGVMNSEVTALAPTASSSIRMGNNEMHEPFTRNLYVRQTIAGSIQIVNKYLMKDLQDLGLWSDEIVNQILQQDGSIQSITSIPQEIRNRYETAYEIDWKKLIDMNADRSPFVSQSISFNHYTSFEDASPTAYTQKIVYAWKKGIKTLSYYMHTETASTAKKEMAQVVRTKQESKTSIPTTQTTSRFECVGCDS